MIKKYLGLILTVLVVIIYVAIQQSSYVKVDKGNSPTITFDQNHIVTSIGQGEEVLLSGVHASDVEDGDLTPAVKIENRSAFTTGTTRTVNYVVFDSAGNVTRASRTIEYADYTKPVFSLTDQLVSEKYSTTTLMNKLHAFSCIDGDISSKIVVKNVSFVEEDKLELMLNVTDSTNTTSYLNLNYYLESAKDIQIMLKDYLVYLDAGQPYDFRGNITNIVEKKSRSMELLSNVEIEVPELVEPGTYEVTYTIELENGNVGKTTMIVVIK